MPDASTTFEVLKDAVRRFVAEREWEKFHSPKNLVMGLAVEAAELMEPFLWLDGRESHQLLDDATSREAVADEMADVAVYLLNLSIVTGIDLSEAIQAKLAKNAAKYPAEEYRGRY